MKNAVIFGGSGFIGTHVAESLLSSGEYSAVYILDIRPPKALPHNIPLVSEAIFYLCDVREPIFDFFPIGSVGLIVNLAAIHREPGHNECEYFETNILGAENVCDFAERVCCNNIIFSSSISTYGSGDHPKNESTLPNPTTPYGVSKLIAEKTHLIWHAKDYLNRRLVVVRPGVVFGPGECGNVTRLIKAVLSRYFLFMGNKETRKGGVYVKELCIAILWVFNRQEETGERVSLFNMTMNPSPSIDDYVTAVCKVAGVHRVIPAVPYWLLFTLSCIIDLVFKTIRVKHPFSPVRIRKLVRSNNILPNYLVKNGYQFQFTIESAFSDWMKLRPDEWR